MPAAQTLAVTHAPTAITVKFSGNVDLSSITATDLVLSGSAVNPMAPAHAASLTWIDDDTVEFNLAGQFDTSGTLDLSLAQNSIQSMQGNSNQGYSDQVVLNVAAITPPTGVTGARAAEPQPEQVRDTEPHIGTVRTRALPGPAAPTPVATPRDRSQEEGHVHHVQEGGQAHVVVAKPTRSQARGAPRRCTRPGQEDEVEDLFRIAER